MPRKNLLYFANMTPFSQANAFFLLASQPLAGLLLLRGRAR